MIVGALTSYDVVERLYQARQARVPEPPAREWQRPPKRATNWVPGMFLGGIPGSAPIATCGE